jgi:hypothetical protein
MAPPAAEEEVLFRLRAPKARRVSIVGTFNDWRPEDLQLRGPDEDGYWYASLVLPRGSHQYKFVVDDAWMVDPENSVGIVPLDPPGCGSLTMRAWSYLLLRWLGDQEGPAGSGAIPGSNEQLFFRELTRGGPSHLAGRANVEQAVATFGSGASWEELMADFLLMPAVDDQPGPSLPERSQLLTWDLRDLYRGLHENTGTSPAFPQPYPLKQQIILFSDVDFDFSVRGSSAKYFSLLATTTAPAYVIRVTDQAGEPLARTRSPQLTIVRLR